MNPQDAFKSPRGDLKITLATFIHDNDEIYTYFTVFDNVLQDPEAKALFKKYLRSRRCEENLLFVEHLQKLSENTILEQHMVLIETVMKLYIEEKSIQQLNLPTKVREQIFDIYNHARKEYKLYIDQVHENNQQQQQQQQNTPTATTQGAAPAVPSLNLNNIQNNQQGADSKPQGVVIPEKMRWFKELVRVLNLIAQQVKANMKETDFAKFTRTAGFIDLVQQKKDQMEKDAKRKQKTNWLTRIFGPKNANGNEAQVHNDQNGTLVHHEGATNEIARKRSLSNNDLLGPSVTQIGKSASLDGNLTIASTAAATKDDIKEMERKRERRNSVVVFVSELRKSLTKVFGGKNAASNVAIEIAPDQQHELDLSFVWKKDVRNWTFSQVAQWLEAQGYGKYQAEFLKQKVTGAQLLMLSTQQLQHQLKVSNDTDCEAICQMIRRAKDVFA